MTGPMSDERLAEILRSWDSVEPGRITVTDTRTPGRLLHALSCAPRDVAELLAEVKQWRATFGESALRDGLARMARVEAERDEARAELAACKRLSTSPMRDEATGLETLCALLHASGAADPNVIKDVAWRTFNLIRAFREQGTERDRLAEQLAVLANAAQRDGSSAVDAVRTVAALTEERDALGAEVERLRSELETVRERLTEESAGLAVAWQAAKDHKDGRDRLAADLEKSRNGAKELGKSVVSLAELIKSAYQRGETDPIAALHMLGDHVAHLFEGEGGLSADEHNRIHRALYERQAEQKRAVEAAAEVARREVNTLVEKASDR